VNRFHLLIGLTLALAAALFFLGKNASRPNEVERIAQDKAVSLARAGEEYPGVARALREVQRGAEFELNQRAKSLPEAQAEEWLRENGEELERLLKYVRQDRAGSMALPQGKTALDVLSRILQHRSAARANGYDLAAGLLAALALAGLALKALKLRRQTKERLIQSSFLATASTSILILLLIMLFLFAEGLPVFKVVSLPEFLFGHLWYPTEDPPLLGILPLIAGSIAVTALSSFIAIPLGVMTAIYLAEIATPRVREIFKPIIELLASLPSVVIGFFGMVVVAPFLQETFHVATGLNLFNASLMLAFMSVPTITSVSEDAIYAVPDELKEASLALGATHLETLGRVIVPASLSGISTAVILGMSRSIGETMVVLMVAGGAGLIPSSIFDPVRPMPASIAAEMGEAPFQSEHYYALFAIGIVLFVFTLMFNIVADHIAHRYKQTGAATL
jgi:phosphate transport system permease protein